MHFWIAYVPLSFIRLLKPRSINIEITKRTDCLLNLKSNLREIGMKGIFFTRKSRASLLVGDTRRRRASLCRSATGSLQLEIHRKRKRRMTALCLNDSSKPCLIRGTYRCCEFERRQKRKHRIPGRLRKKLPRSCRRARSRCIC